METTMAQVGRGFELNGDVNYLRIYRRDWEVRIGAWTMTMLWGFTPYDGGLYLVGPNADVHWCWEHIQERLVFWRGWTTA
jgi:hypothetical protein